MSKEQTAAAPGEIPLIVTGSTGRIGRLLRLAWRRNPPAGLRPVWQTRRPATDPDEVEWDILAGPLPGLPRAAVILHLAGSTARSQPVLDQHAPLAAAVCAAAAQIGARRVLHASSAAIYGKSDSPHAETDDPAPFSPYGVAKLAAERALCGPVPRVILRIGNIAGADALLGGARADATRDVAVLDPVAGQPGGPVRSYIGPDCLVSVLARLALLPALPEVLNIAQPAPVAMADLLQAAGRAWHFGPVNPAVIPRVELATDRLKALCPDLPDATAAGLVAEVAALQGLWP